MLQVIAYWALWVVVSPLTRLCFRIRSVNRPPSTGAYVLAANHCSLLDPVLLSSVMRRRLTFLMTVIHHRNPMLGWFYRLVRAIPLEVRGANRESLRAAHSRLEHGEVLSIFPEGGISRDGEPLLGNPGAVALVLAQKVPVIPVAIVGAYQVLPPGATLPRLRRVEIRFGDAITHAELAALGNGSRKARLGAATRRIMDAIAELGGKQSREMVLAEIHSDRKRRTGAGNEVPHSL